MNPLKKNMNQDDQQMLIILLVIVGLTMAVVQGIILILKGGLL